MQKVPVRFLRTTLGQGLFTKSLAQTPPITGITDIPEHFQRVNEISISKEMIARFSYNLDKATNSDVIVVGTGIAGLACAYELSKSTDLSITLVERSFALGGTSWIGAQVMGSMAVRKPAHFLLEELDVPYDERDGFVVIPHASSLTSTLISKISNSGNVNILNGIEVEDVLLR